MTKKKKDEDFIRDVIRRRGKRESRDDVFTNMLNTSYLEQREQLRDWIYTEILDIKYIIEHLRPLARDNMGVATIDHAEDRVERLEKTYDKILKSKISVLDQNTPPEDVDKLDVDLSIENLGLAFTDINAIILPVVRELILIRNWLDFIYDMTP